MTDFEHLISGSPYMDREWYLETYADVRLLAMDPVRHYLMLGVPLGRNPSRHFNTKGYLEANPDVAAAGLNPLVHYELWGRMEGRQWSNAAESYDEWVKSKDTLTASDLEQIREAAGSLANQPLISVLMPVYNPTVACLDEAIRSVREQVYDNWELCIADDCSTDPAIRSLLKDHAAQDRRIKIVFRASNGHISRATNSAFELARGQWIAGLDHDDILRPHALAEVAFLLDRCPDAEVIYSDEDKIDNSGRRYDPYFKPDYTQELFRSQNYLNHLTVHRASNIRAVGGWRAGFEGSQDYDLNLRIIERLDPANIRHIPRILYHWRAVEGSTARAGGEKSYAHGAARKALEEHVARLGLQADIIEVEDTPYFRLKHDLPPHVPLVSIIIPTRNGLELLRGCVESIHERTTYPHYEILVVDNNSDDPATLDYLDELASSSDVRVLRYNGPFNFSAINNAAVAQANGDFVTLLNNDIEVISPDWLTEMVSWAMQPDTGCVGAKLYYGDGTIQHAGIILGIGGVAGHSHKHFAGNSRGYFSRLKLCQNISAVTAACLLIRTSIYRQVGGLNETDLKVAFNDVDFCLRVQDSGYTNIWTPFAELFHLESTTRGHEDTPQKKERFQREVIYMKREWGDRLMNDPYYSPCLTVKREDFSISLSQPFLISSIFDVRKNAEIL